MTPSEFKAWFAVFAEAVDGTPTPKQWAKIKARVATVAQESNNRIGLNGTASQYYWDNGFLHQRANSLAEAEPKREYPYRDFAQQANLLISRTSSRLNASNV